MTPEEKKQWDKDTYLASKIREHLNSVGYELSIDTESLIRQVLQIDGKDYDSAIKS